MTSPLFCDAWRVNPGVVPALPESGGLRWRERLCSNRKSRPSGLIASSLDQSWPIVFGQLICWRTGQNWSYLPGAFAFPWMRDLTCPASQTLYVFGGVGYDPRAAPIADATVQVARMSRTPQGMNVASWMMLKRKWKFSKTVKYKGGVGESLLIQ